MHRWLVDTPAERNVCALWPVFALGFLTAATPFQMLAADLPDTPANEPKAAAQMRHFEIIKGKVRVQGSSNLDDWQVESVSIQGVLDLGSGFPPQPTQKAASGPIAARARIELSALSLKSVEKDGKPFSNKMDEIMYEKLRAPAHPKIVYRLQRLLLKEASENAEAPFLLESAGELLVAGITNQITVPIKLWNMENNRLKLSGSTSLRMTDFRIEPPSPKIALGFINTDNDVKLSFECVLAEKEGSHE